MNADHVLALYDENERIHIHESDTRREEADGVVRYINLLSPRSFVLYMDVPDEAIDGTIDRQIAYFDGMGHDFEWKVFSHDRRRIWPRGWHSAVSHGASWRRLWRST